MSEIDRKVLRQLSQMAGPDCPPIKTLGDLIDEKLSPTAKESLEMHVQSCPACINRLIELRELSHLQAEGAQPPPALLEAVKSMVRAQARSTSPGARLHCDPYQVRALVDLDRAPPRLCTAGAGWRRHGRPAGVGSGSSC